MIGYVARRLLLAIPTLLAISVVLFAMLHLAPGGPMAIYAQGPDTDPAQLDAIDPLDRLHHLIAPALVLATLEIAGWSRYLRSSLLEVAHQDYIRTAQAKGVHQRVVMYRHILRNALLPLITLVGLQGGRLIGGALVTEVIFAWPGMGRLLSESLSARDYPVVMAALMLMAVAVVLGNLLADVGYVLADPRVRLS